MCCIELDVRLTADNKVVVFHDHSLTRMTNGKLDVGVEELNYKDLPNLEPSEGCQITKGDRKTYPIPLFSEVLALLQEHPDLTMIVEFKENDDELVKLVHEMVSPYRERIIWFSLKTPIVNKLRAYDASMPTIVGALEALQYALCYYMGILPFLSLPFCVFGITLQDLPLSKLRSERSLSALPDALMVLLSYLLAGCPPWFLSCAPLFTHLQERGYPVWFLGCNEERHVVAAQELGANAVLTDKPRWLADFMAERGTTLRRNRDSTADDRAV